MVLNRIEAYLWLVFMVKIADRIEIKSIFLFLVCTLWCSVRFFITVIERAPDGFIGNTILRSTLRVESATYEPWKRDKSQINCLIGRINPLLFTNSCQIGSRLKGEKNDPFPNHLE